MTTFSIHDISERLNTSEPALLFGDFLDSFSRADSATRQEMISAEPVYYESHKQLLCEFAAAVELLCERYSLSKPDWISEDRYYMDVPCFALNTQNPAYQEYLQQTTFPAYGKRNLFLGDSVLERV